MDELASIGQIINGLGTVGVLLWLAYSFVNGRLVSGKTHEEQVKLTAEMAHKVLTDGFKSAVQEAVKHGFIEAWHEIGTRRGEKPDGG